MKACKDPDFFTGRSEGQKGERFGFALPPAGLPLSLRAEGAANHQTFCPSDLPVKKSRSLDVARNRHGSFCDSGCKLAAHRRGESEFV
jgi:hypothetical protein